MFTVIIQSQETARLGADYRRLFFSELVNSGDVAFCTWIKTGDSVDTALPALYKLISGKQAWRAIVVQTECDREQAPEARQDNPFDYLANVGQTEHRVSESKIPLIRLSHILAGIPEPEVRFEPREIVDEETNKVSRVVYIPVKDSQEQAEYDRLTAKYRMTENRPAEIIMISTRQYVDHTAEEVHAAWSTRLESQSSDFCYRNYYPDLCRFVAFDVLNDRHSLYSGCIFRLWTFVMLLAQNRITPSSLQAYRLYCGNVQLDKDKLTDLFDCYLDQMISMTSQLDAEDANQESLRVEAAKESPLIRENIQVLFQAKDNGSLFVTTRDLGLTTDRPQEEHTLWHERYRAAMTGLRELIKSPRRALDIAADDCRQKSVYPPKEVKLLNDFQKTDLQDELEQYYLDSLNARSRLGFNISDREQEHRLINQQVRTRIAQRLTHSKAAAGFGIALGTTALVMLPSMIHGLRQNGVSSLLLNGLLALGSVAVVALFGYAELRIQRREMVDAMEDHNRVMTQTLLEVDASAQHYTSYLSALCSYQRGQSYLLEDGVLRSGRANVNQMRRRHRIAIQHNSAIIRQWAQALGLSLSPVHNVDQLFSFDASQTPEDCPAYAATRRYSHNRVKMVGSGEPLDFAFDFVTAMSLEREELYDNVNGLEPD